MRRRATALHAMSLVLFLTLRFPLKSRAVFPSSDAALPVLAGRSIRCGQHMRSFAPLFHALLVWPLVRFLLIPFFPGSPHLEAA